MKRILQSLLLVFLALVSFNCQKELSGDHFIAGHASNQASPLTATLQGNVLDENGQPASGARISAGSKTALSDSRGYFRITEAPLDRNSALVIAEQPGYFKAYRTFMATPGTNQVVFKMVKKKLAGTINSAAGGAVSLQNGARVSLPPNAVTTVAGGNYTGTIQVYAAYIDPTSSDIGITVPGSFMADDKNGDRVVLSSYGMLAVELESASGDKLQIGNGNVATLTTPIPSSRLASAPASISMWYVDEQTGTWKEQGLAKKSGGVYVGDVPHFSYWNCDISAPAVSFTAKFTAKDGSPLTNLYVGVRPADSLSGGYAHGYTDSLGQVSGLVPAGQDLVLEVYGECYNAVYSENIGPFTGNADLGTIIIPGTASTLVTIRGRLLSCNNSPVTDGYAIVYWNNYRFSPNADVNGNFSTTIFKCAGTSSDIEVLGVDKSATEMGTMLSVPITSPLTDVGNITACGISLLQYIKYTLDGKDFTISTPMFDSSLMAFSIADGNLLKNFIRGYKSDDNSLTFDFTTGSRTAGVYPVNALSVISYTDITLKAPFNVNVTAFPLYPEELYEGSFEGSFTDGSDAPVVHNIKGSFRIRTR